MSFADDAEQWRSAIDPKSGKTYWYHRVNRISTWIRPPFMPDLLTSPAPSSYSSSSPLLTPVIFENRGPLVEKISDHKYSSDLITKSTTENKSSDVHAESQKELQRTSPHHLSTRIQNAVSCLTRSEEHLRVDALLLLTSRCGIAAEISAELSKMPSLLSNLVGIISRGESKICRRLALSILCSFAICKNSSSIFQDNQSWVIISRKFLYWDGDKESTLLFCNLICCLLDRPARCVIPNETVESIGDLLGYMLDDYRTYSKSGQIDLLSLRILSSGSSSSFLPGDWNFLYCLYIGAEKGHHTSSLLLLVILSSAIGSIPNNSMKEEREESYMNDSALVLNVLQFGGGASILKSLSSAGNVDESVRRRARDLLLEGMAKSAYLRESVMDGFLNLSFGYSFQQNIDRKADENDFSREDDREDSKRREGAVLPLGARSEFKSLALQSIAVDSILDVSWRYEFLCLILNILALRYLLHVNAIESCATSVLCHQSVELEIINSFTYPRAGHAATMSKRAEWSGKMSKY